MSTPRRSAPNPARPGANALLGAGLGVLAAVLLLPGCDNTACVFAGTCQNQGGNTTGDPGGLGNGNASFPADGSFLTGNAPDFVGAAPAIVDAHPETPVFLEFTESLDPSTINGSFEIVDLVFQQPIPLLPPVLAGNGRVVVLLPFTDYMEGQQLVVRFAEDQELTDLNGQRYGGDTEDPLLEFSVNSTNQNAPRLLYAYPPDLSINQSNISEVVIGFDRRLDASTVNAASFDVTVDDVDPAFDPDVVALTLGSGPASSPRTQVWLWTPFDTDSRAIPYGTDGRVRVRMSPTGNTILSEAGNALPFSESEFQTLDFSPPLSVLKAVTAPPLDAFGRADVFGSGPLVDVTLAEPAPPGLMAEIFMTGRSPSNVNLNRALVRTVTVPESATSISISAPELELFDSLGKIQFADGDIEVAVQLRRSTRRSGIRRFDADRTTTSFELPAFDTTPPMLLGLGASGANTSNFVSDVRDFAVVGRANEEVAFAFVDAGMAGINGGSLAAPPSVAFSAGIPDSSESLFVAAPVPVGVVDPAGPGVSYTVTIYDRAFNASEVLAVGTFRQRGVVGPGGAPTGATIGVRAFDERSLTPIAGALVFSHQEQGGAVTFVGTAVTGADGTAAVPGAAIGDTVITVDAAGFDLFTFHGVPRDAVEIPLRVTSGTPGGVSGEVRSVFPTGNFQTSTNVVADSRANPLDRLGDVMMCGINQTATSYVCEFGPILVRSRTVGAMTFLASEQTLAQGAFNPVNYLRGFALTGPLPPVNGGADLLDVTLDAGDQLLLSPPGEQAVAITPHVLSSAAATNLGMLDGEPVLTVEAAATGLGGPLVVGRAIPYTLSPSSWTVLGAVAGIAGPGGELETSGAIDPDLHLRAALRDVNGNEVAARPRLSGSMNQLNPIDVPLFVTPGPGGMSGGSSYNVVVADTLPDALGLEGLVRVELTGSSGRGWSLVGLDTSDAAGDLLLSVPNIGAQGGSGLPTGSITAEVRLFGGAFDRGNFLWTDIGRNHEQFGRAAPVTFTQN